MKRIAVLIGILFIVVLVGVIPGCSCNEDTSTTSDASGSDMGAKAQVLVFSTPTCPACPSAKALVGDLVKDMGDAIAYLDIDASSDVELARQYRIQAVPTIVVLYPGGEIVDIFVGTPPESTLQAALDEAIAR